MKIKNIELIGAAILFAAVNAFAASPSYENFNAGDFQRSGNSVRLKQTLTNNITGTAATASGLDATGLGIIDTRRKNSLASGTNNIAGNGAGLTNLQSATISVRHAGVDTAYPYWYNLTNNVLPGDTVIISAGVLNCSNYFILPAGVKVDGAGRTATMLASWFTNGLPTPLIIPTLNNEVSSLSISNVFQDPAGTEIPSACIGTHSGVGGTGYTNFTGFNLVLYGGSDTWYNRSSNNVSGKLINCDLYGPWDIITMFGVTGGTTSTQNLVLEGCSLYHYPTASHGNAYDIAVNSFECPGNIKFINCNLVISNGVAGKVSYFWNDNPGAALRASAEFYNCILMNARPAAGDSWALDAGSVLKLVNTPTDQSKLGDGFDASPGIKFGTNTVDVLKFGGDSVVPAPELRPTSDGLFLTLSNAPMLAIGLASYSTTAAVNIAATGWTNTFGVNATVYVTATAVAWTIKNRANSTIYTSPTLTATTSVHLQPGWSVNAASGLAGTALPD